MMDPQNIIIENQYKESNPNKFQGLIQARKGIEEYQNKKIQHFINKKEHHSSNILKFNKMFNDQVK